LEDLIENDPFNMGKIDGKGVPMEKDSELITGTSSQLKRRPGATRQLNRSQLIG